jgi:hypothetical protein
MGMYAGHFDFRHPLVFHRHRRRGPMLIRHALPLSIAALTLAFASGCTVYERPAATQAMMIPASEPDMGVALRRVRGHGCRGRNAPSREPPGVRPRTSSTTRIDSSG